MDDVRLAARWHAGSISLLARQSATLAADEGAAVLVQDVSTPDKPGVGYSHHVALHVKGFAGWGLAFDGAGLAADGTMAWQAGIQSLSLSRFLQRDLSGSVAYSAASGSYAFDASSLQADDHLHTPFQRPFASSGWGLRLQRGSELAVEQSGARGFACR